MTTNIYHQSIKQLAAADTGAGTLENSDVSMTMDNPLCGDRITLQLSVLDSRITHVAHTTKGCMLCKAAASLIGRTAQGCSNDEITKLTRQLAAMLKQGVYSEWGDQWQSLSFFEPVQPHKSRHECVLLPFKALSAALSEISE